MSEPRSESRVRRMALRAYVVLMFVLGGGGIAALLLAMIVLPFYDVGAEVAFSMFGCALLGFVMFMAGEVIWR